MSFTIHKEPYPHIKEVEILATLSPEDKAFYDSFMRGSTCCKDASGAIGIYPHDYYSFAHQLEKQKKKKLVQEINQTIAQLCGWKWGVHNTKSDEGWIHPDGILSTIYRWPDYYNDLNAMHEAEKILLGLDIQYAYAAMLKKVMGDGDYCIYKTPSKLRAKALLSLKNLWKDEWGKA